MSDQAHGPRAVAVPTSDRRDYLKKRHMREGPNRRRFGVSDALDVEMDTRNERVWECVRVGLLVVAGFDPLTKICRKSRDDRSKEKIRAIHAAAWVAHHEHGIPVTRLHEITGYSITSLAPWLRDYRGVKDLVVGWHRYGGPATVDKVECVPVLITKEAALALAKAARESGDSPIALVSAAVLASASRGRRCS